MAGINPRRSRAARRIWLAFLLASAAAPLNAAATAATGAAAAQSEPDDDPNRDIIIYGQPLFRDVTPERSFDEDDIASYGVSTVDELIGDIEVELGEEGEQPLILVNGKRINDLSEIGALPVEALRSLEVLPRGSAIRAGGTSRQRVISLTLNRRTRTATLTGGHKIATDGDWNADRGEAILTDVRGERRLNLALRARGDSNLLESERGIIQRDPRLPYALSGNVIAFPTNPAREIDPLLSEHAGEIVTVAPVPAGANPTLASFASSANKPALTDLGAFRTLRPNTSNYDLNASFATRLAPWLTSSTTLRLGRNVSRSKRGLPAGLFVLSSDNPASPFSRDVGLVY